MTYVCTYIHNMLMCYKALPFVITKDLRTKLVQALDFSMFLNLFNIYQARPLIEEYAINKLVDPRLENCYSEHEVYCMLHAASSCIKRDPHSRPRMSQVRNICIWMRDLQIHISK